VKKAKKILDEHEILSTLPIYRLFTIFIAIFYENRDIYEYILESSSLNRSVTSSHLV
jgi:hypothetical protein